MSARKLTTVVLACLAVLAAAVSPLLLVSAACPSNGNTHAIYVTSNMGDNIWSFDTHGTYLGEVINAKSFPADVKVQKLRAMRFGPGGHLYVSSARGSYSRIVAVSGNGVLNKTLTSGCGRDYLFTALHQDAANPFLDHPYDFAFHPVTNDLFVSNQNSITVTKYTFKGRKSGGGGAAGSEEGAAAAGYVWEPVANVKTAVPRAQNMTTEAEVPDSFPNNAGLFASSWSPDYTLSSVRGVALSPLLPRAIAEGSFSSGGYYTLDERSALYYLLVCDPAANKIHVFDPDSGERLFIIAIPSPVQVAFTARTIAAAAAAPGGVPRKVDTPYIYVTSREDGMAYMVPFVPPSSGPGLYAAHAGQHRPFKITAKAPLQAASGIYENPSRDVVLVADRISRRITSYATPFVDDLYLHSSGPAPNLGVFTARLPDQPEFVLSTLVEHQRKLPFCYELGPSGALRYVALCRAAYFWSIVLLLALLAVPAILFYKQIAFCVGERRRDSAAASEEQPLLDSNTDGDEGRGAIASYGAADRKTV